MGERGLRPGAPRRQGPHPERSASPQDGRSRAGLTSIWQLAPVEEGGSLRKSLEQRAEQAAEEEEEVRAARLLAELEGDRPG